MNASNSEASFANLDKLTKAFLDFSAISDLPEIKERDKKVVLAISNLYLKVKKSDLTQAKAEQLVAEINALIACYHSTGHFIVASKKSRTLTKNIDNQNPTAQKTTTSPTKKRKFLKVRLRKASYQYNSERLAVSKKLLQKGSIIKTSNEIYLIKGKSFYRIANNYYVPVSNT